jgi:hypothetical protein
MSSGLKDSLQRAGLCSLWRQRAEALREQLLAEQQLLELHEEHSVLERWLFLPAASTEQVERQLRGRLRELEQRLTRTGAELEAAWQQLERGHPELAEPRALERALSLCLAARSAEGIQAAQTACRALLEPALEQVGEAPPREPVDPDRAAQQLFAAAGQAHLIPLSALQALLEQAQPMRESSWDQARQTITFRPVLIALVDQVLQAWTQARPDSPPPSLLLAQLLAREGEESGGMPEGMRQAYPAGDSRQKLDELIQLFTRLAGHQLALRLNRREISFFDRVVFWSDTPAEAREKDLLSARAVLCEEAEAGWLDLERRLRTQRREQWALYSADQALVVRDAVRELATTEGEASSPRSCPLLNQEKAIWQVQAFINEIAQRYGAVWTREALLEAALAEPEQEPPPEKREPESPSQDSVRLERLPALLAPGLRACDFPQRYQAMLEALEQVQLDKDALREARARVSTWERATAFKESAAEAREKAMTKALSEGEEQAAAAQKAVEQELETILLELHHPALLGVLLQELVLGLDQVRAECTSNTRSYLDSQGQRRFETMYYCTLRGIEYTHELLCRALDRARPAQGTYLPLLEAAERWALADSQNAPALTVLSPTG